jgi:hypothetical protein
LIPNHLPTTLNSQQHITKMPSLPISNKPSNFVWADDEEDDWDFDTHTATTDNSAPTLDSLPPLQVSSTEEETTYAVYSSPTSVVEAAPEDTPPLQYNAPVYYHPGDGNIMTARTLIQDRHHARPAYPDMSSYEDGMLEPSRTVSYSSNWQHTKIRCGWDGREIALLRISKLCQVDTIKVDTTTADEIEEIPRTDSCIDSDTLDPIEPICTGDEGYYTDSSRPTSPSSPTSQERLSISCCATQVGIALAMSFFSLRGSPSQKTIEIDDEPLDAITSPPTTERPAQDIDIIDEKPGLSTPSSRAAVMSWLFATNTTLITTAFVATGLLAGTGMYLVRRRGR